MANVTSGKRLAISLLIAGAIVQLVALERSSGTEIAVDPTTTVTYAAVARYPSIGTWRYLADGSHVKSGFTSIRCDRATGALFMHYEAMKSVASMWVSPDETLARRGILAGASVNRDHWRILFTRVTANGPRPLSCASSLLRGNAANIWVGLIGQPATG